MTKKIFQEGEKIGPYTIDEFGGTTTKGESTWWVIAENGKPELVKELKLRKILRTAELTPREINAMSSKAYEALRQEIGDDGIDEIMKSSKSQTTSQAPTPSQQREIARKYFEAHPQIPQTRENSKLINDWLGRMKNPTFTSRDFDLAVADLFFQLELHPKAAGIQGHGEAIRGKAAIDKLTASEYQQLQRAFPVAAPVDSSGRTRDEIIKEVGSLPISADQFIKWTKEVDKTLGIAQPVPPLLASDRERIWGTFFQCHPNVLETPELRPRLLSLLKKKSEFNPTDEDFPVLNQHLDSALQFLIERNDPVVQQGEPNRRTHEGMTHTVYDQRPRSPLVQDDAPITITADEINKMSSEEYGKKSLNPQFRAAVERLTKGVGVS